MAKQTYDLVSAERDFYGVTAVLRLPDDPERTVTVFLSNKALDSTQYEITSETSESGAGNRVTITLDEAIVEHALRDVRIAEAWLAQAAADAYHVIESGHESSHESGEWSVKTPCMQCDGGMIRGGGLAPKGMPLSVEVRCEQCGQRYTLEVMVL